MRFIFRAAVAAIVVTTPVGSSAQTAGARGQASGDTSMSGSAADARARIALDSLRRAVLRYATFAGFAEAACAPGDIRTFERDTTGAVKKLLARFELLVLSYGAFTSLENTAGRALLRAVVRLEGGGPGPRWDVLTGTGPPAFNPLLPTKMLNIETKRCEQTPGTEPFGIVLPDVKGFVVPRDSGAGDFVIAYGPKGLNELREFYFARHGSEPEAKLIHTRINAHALWENYAVVSVVRERALRGVAPLPSETTGSVYAFRRVGADWRLLAVIRTW